MLRVKPKISNTKISNTKPDSEHFEVLTLKLKDGREDRFAVFAVAFAVFAVAHNERRLRRRFRGLRGRTL